MDQKIYENITQAIQVIHNPNSNQQLRAQAQQFLDNFKEKGTNIGAYGLALLNKSNADQLRHFGLQILEFLVNSKWKTFDGNEKENFVSTLFSYCSNGTKPMLEEQKFIKEKVASCLVSVLKREWPQKMPKLLGNILDMYQGTPTTIQIATLCIKSFAEDLSDEFADELEPERKSQLRKAFVEVIPKIFILFYSLFDNIYKQFKQKPDKATHTILSNLLECCIALGDKWNQADVFEAKFHVIWCTLAQEKTLRMLACDCLFLLASKTFSSKLYALEFWNTFGKMAFSAITSKNVELVADYQFHKLLCKILVAFGAKNLSLFSKQDNDVIVAFLNMLLQFDNHPSTTIFEDTIPMWSLILTEPFSFISKMDAFSRISTQLLTCISHKMLKEVGNPENEKLQSHPTNRFSSLDFEGQEDYRIFFSGFRSSMAVIVETLSKMYPQVCLTFAVQAVGSVLNKKGPTDTDDVSPMKTCTVYSYTFILWEAASTLFEWIMTGLMRSHPKFVKDQTKLLEELLGALLKYETHDPNLQTRFLHVLKNLNGLYEANVKTLDAVLTCLFKAMCFLGPNETINSKSEDTSAARQKAYSVFVAISREHSKYLLPYLKSFVEKTHEMMKNNLISDSEITMLNEALVVISLEMQSFGDQVGFLKFLLDHNIVAWKSKPFSEICGSEVLILKSFEVISEPDQRIRELLISTRKKLGFTLTIFASVLKRMLTDPKKSNLLCEEGIYKYPIAPFLPDILPNVFTLARTIHSLQTFASKLPREWKGALKIGYNEQLLLTVIKAPQMNDFEKKTSFISNTLKVMRMNCYGVLANSCKYGDVSFWKNESLFSNLTNSIFSFLDVQDNKCLFDITHYFLKIFIPACPEKHYSNLFSLVANFYQILNARLKDGWTTVIQSNVTDVEIMVQERILRDLNREALDIISECFSSLRPVGKGNAKPKPNNMANFIISSSCGEIFVLVAIASLHYPDSSTVNTSIQILNNLLPFMTEKYIPVLAGELLGAAIRGLMNHKEDLHVALIALITQVYYSYYLKSKLPEQVLKAIPHVTDQAVKKLHNELKGGTTEKARKKLMSNLLKPIIGKHSGEFKKPKTITNIKTQGNVENAKKNKEQSTLDVSITNISSLFRDDE